MRRLISTVIVTVLAISTLGAVTGPDRAVAQGDALVPAAVLGTVTVDERSDGFTPKGFGWHSDSFGYAGHHYWARTSWSPHLVGIWRASLEPGLYRVLAKVPTRHASSRKANYKVKTADGWVKRVRNQYKSRGSWMGLGTHEFKATAEVRLADKTLDPRGSGRKLSFDAVRFIPVEPPVINNLAVEPKHVRVIVTFSLAAAGPAKTEYRKVGATDWIVGADEMSSKYADYRQVITGLKAETEYELRVIATNKGGKTISPVASFRTLDPLPPVDQ